MSYIRGKTRAGFAGRPVDHSVVQSYFRQRFFIPLVRRESNDLDEKVVRNGNASAVFALSASVYLLRSDSQPFATRRKGNRRRYSCPAASPCLRADVHGNRHFRIARHSQRNIHVLTVFSRRLQAPRSDFPEENRTTRNISTMSL